MELRRRDADIRSFASAAALQQERCGQRLREQALTIHQLTLQGFSAEAQAESHAAAIATAAASTAEATTTGARTGTTPRDDKNDASATKVRVRMPTELTATATSTEIALAAAAAAVAERPGRPAPRRRYYDEGLRESRQSMGAVSRGGALTTTVTGGTSPRAAIPNRSDVFLYGNKVSNIVNLRAASGGSNEDGWAGHSLDSGFPGVRLVSGRGESDVCAGGDLSGRHRSGHRRGPRRDEEEALNYSQPEPGFGQHPLNGSGAFDGNGSRVGENSPSYREF